MVFDTLGYVDIEITIFFFKNFFVFLPVMLYKSQFRPLNAVRFKKVIEWKKAFC